MGFVLGDVASGSLVAWYELVASMIIEDIWIKKSIMEGTPKWVMYIEISGFKYSGYFEDFGGFLTAVQEAGTFFAYRLGKIKLKDAQPHMTRQVN